MHHSAARALAIASLFAVAAACSSSSTNATVADSAISGKVVLTGATDASGVVVTAVGPSTGSAQTAADGTFKIASLAPGNYLVSADVSDSLERTQSTYLAVVTDAVASTLTFTLVGTLSGTAQRTGSSDPSNIFIRVLGTDLGAVTDSAGNYQISGVQLGAATVSASATGFLTATANITAARGNTTVPALTLAPVAAAPTATLTVNVAGAGLVSSSPAGIGCSSSCQASFPVGTNAILTATPAAGYTFTSWSISSCLQPFCSVALAQDTTVTATFTPTAVATGTIRGSVILNGVSDASGVLVTASGNGASGSALTAVDGTYSIDSLPPGNYSVTAAVSDSVEKTAGTEVSLTANSALASPLSFTIIGSIVGTAQKAAAADNSNISIAVLGTDLSAVTDSGGNYRIDGVRLGAISVGASAAGYLSASATATAARGTTTIPAISLNPVTVALNINVVGNGLISSVPAGLGCSSTCSAAFAPGSVVTLYASPSTGYAFKSWSNASCTQNTCQLTLTQATSITATFTAVPPILATIEIVGPGRGNVTSEQIGQQLTLTAVPEPGYTFAGWLGGACSGTGACVLTASATVQAAFTEAFFWVDGPQTIYALSALAKSATRGTISTSKDGQIVGGHLTGVEPTGAADLASRNSGIYGVGLLGGPIDYLSSGPAFNADSFGTAPDGLSLSYVSTTPVNLSVENTDYNLWSLDLVTGDALPLTDYEDDAGVQVATDFPPRYSPDGQTIAFFSNQDPTSLTEAPLENGGWNLWTVQRDGTKLRSLTYFLNDELDPNDSDGAPDTRAYDWSPDGTKLAFVAYGVGNNNGSCNYGNIYVVNSDGSGLNALTNFNCNTISDDPNIFSVTWSPDGSKIAFLSHQLPGPQRTGTSQEPGINNVWTLSVASGALYCVTDFAQNWRVGDALYAKTGHAIVFVAQQSNSLNIKSEVTNLWSINDDGSGLTALTHSTGLEHPDYNEAPVWYVDNTTLLYESNDSTSSNAALNGKGGNALFSLPFPSGTPVQATDPAQIFPLTSDDDDD